MYGTNAQSSYCPVRDGTYPQAISDLVTRQWAILYAEFKTSSSPNTPSMLRRRNYLYTLMGKVLADLGKKVFARTMTGLASAAVVELRLGEYQKAKMHFNALKHLVQVKYGIESTKNMPQCESTIIMIAYLGMAGQDNSSLLKIAGMEKTKRRLIDTLRAVATWNQTSTLEACGKAFQESSRSHFAPELIGDISNPLDRNSEVTGLASCNSSLLLSYIRLTHPQENVVQKISHLLILYNINLVFWELRSSTTRKATFISKILGDINSSMDSGITKQQLQINTVALMVLYRSSEAVEKNGQKDALWRLLNMLDLVSIMLLLSQESWDLITTMLSHLLTGNAEDVIISDEAWEAIDREVTMHWLQNLRFA